MLLLANFETAPCPVRIRRPVRHAVMRRMDEKAARLAVEDAEAYRMSGRQAGGQTSGQTATLPLPLSGGSADLVLSPCEWVRIDLA